MPQDTDKDRWKIRFGQIFQALLVKAGKKLEDYFYFMPSGTQPDHKTAKSFELIDLNINRNLNNRYFSSQVLEVPKLSKETAKRLDAALVIVPGIGHHIIATRIFADQIQWLKDLGFEVVYAGYEDSFASNESCARRVYEMVKANVNPLRPLVFLTCSKGSPVMLELFSDHRYEDVTARTKALVSFAGALRGSPLVSGPTVRLARHLLKLYRKISANPGYTARIKRTFLKWLSKLPFQSLKNLQALVEKTFELEDDLRDLPEGIMDLTRGKVEKEYANIRLPEKLKLFSISAVYPESAFTDGFRFIRNADDLFLYVSGGELYRQSVFTDLQLLLPDSEFFPGTGEIINLGIVKAHHWGITISRVFSKKHTNPFPRTEMLAAVLLILDEYLNPSP